MSITTCPNETCSDQKDLLQAKQKSLTFVTSYHQLPITQQRRLHEQQQRLHEQWLLLSGVKCHEKSVMVDTLIFASANIIDNIWFGQILKRAPPSSCLAPEVGAAATPAATPVSTNTISTALFIREILIRSRASFSMLQLALFYILRIQGPILAYVRYQQQQQQQQPAETRPDISNVIYCRKRMFIAALMAAFKFLNDKNYRNHQWAIIANLNVKEINRAEIIFLRLIDYQLYVSKQLYEAWLAMLYDHLQKRTSSGMLNIHSQFRQPLYQQSATLANVLAFNSWHSNTWSNDMSNYIRRLRQESHMENSYYASLDNQQQQQDRTTTPECNCPAYYACVFYDDPIVMVSSAGSEDDEAKAKAGRKRTLQPFAPLSTDEPCRKSSKNNL